MNPVRGIYDSLFKKLLPVYTSSRTKCMIVFDGDRHIAVDICMVLQPFPVTAEVKDIWKSESLWIVEKIAPLPETYEYREFLASDTITIGDEDIILLQDEKIGYEADRLHGSSWKHRYYSESEGISFTKRTRTTEELKNRLNRQIADEVRYHYQLPYHDIESLTRDLLGTNRDRVNHPIIEVAVPFWARALEPSINVTNKTVRCEYMIAPSVQESGNLRGWLTYVLKDGQVLPQAIGWKEDKKQDRHQHEFKYSMETELLYGMKDISSITSTVNLDDEFGLSFKTTKLEVSRHLLWPVLMKLDESIHGNMRKFLDGKHGKIHCDGFEIVVMNLLSSLGFRTVYIGFESKTGADIIATPPDEDYLILIECSRGNVKQKVANCIRQMEKLKEEFQNLRFRGAVMISEEVPQITREAIGRTDIAIFDSTDLERLAKHAELNPNIDLIMDLYRGVSTSIPVFAHRQW
ncbi:MAG: hypothetical protein ACXADL_07535 [Candidatus Thorarchaeota archaeon]